MVCIADTGFLVALFGKPAERAWARKEFEVYGAPFFTCEAALAEAAHFVDSSALVRLLDEGDVEIGFAMNEQRARIRQLLEKYRGTMDFTDACIVRMSEIFPHCSVFTVDRNHFKIYRRFGREMVPVSTPRID